MRLPIFIAKTHLTIGYSFGLGCLLCLGFSVVHAAEPITISWRLESTRVVVEVAGVTTEALSALVPSDGSRVKWEEIFPVFAQQEATSTVPPMAGAWSVVDKRLRFESRFPLMQGVRYRAEYRRPPAAPIVGVFMLPAESTVGNTTVVQVFPSAKVLPENQLKFYVQFSAPMSRGGIYHHVHIRDARGQIIELPFLELEEELWDPAMTRLTLLIDPGRIKRGVKPLEDIGPVFETGKAYSLTVDADFHDATGRPLRATFEKKFRVGPADRAPPDPTRWTIRPVAVGSREPLVVDFGEPLDQALALRLINVLAGTEGTRSLSGERSLAEQEQQWKFVPEQPWQRGVHRLIVATTIEDLAGNNIGKAFDVDVFENVQRRVTTESVSVAFEVK
jgi:hypothetical protein